MIGLPLFFLVFQFISFLSKRDRAFDVLVYIQMFRQNAIALTIGRMNFLMPMYPHVVSHTIDKIVIRMYNKLFNT
ncbi:hypothetical protein PI95_005190 [Hassallia byssoidea VB512170]|uniref:Uncharacterized protein n=1 Tax=Hassallia byssoidea VB512170 TaxID=1304833 RepID=A0A846H442_9CYAN|nr:hypothetical protein [Hassalia byssoidea]NEU71985.1 hypothetical protein [Hassalia byssoidea VB512170]